MKRHFLRFVMAAILPVQAFAASTDSIHGYLSLTARALGPDGRPCQASMTFWRAVESELGEEPPALSFFEIAAQSSRWRDSLSGKVWQPFQHFGRGESATVDKLGPGDYRVTAALHAGPTPFGVSEVIHLDDSRTQQTTTVRLLAGPSLTVTATDAHTQVPVDWFQVRLECEDGLPVTRWSSASWAMWSRDGRIRFDQLPPGTYRMTAGRTSTQYGWPEYAAANNPIEIEIVAMMDQQIAVPLKEVQLSEEVVRQRWPFVVQGRVTDVLGQPLPGVTINAFCGIGTLLRTGQATSGPDGRYRLRFRGGMSMKDRDRWRVGLQAATISASKQDWFEVNLHRQGGLFMADETPSVDNAWGAKAEQVILPHQPYALDFVMRRAASVVGQLLGEQGQPLANYKLWIDGDQLPPSCNVLARTDTDKEGRFRFSDVPTHFAWHFNVADALPLETRFETSGEHSVTLQVIRDSSANISRLRQAPSTD